MNKSILVLQIADSVSFEKVFGSSTVRAAGEDITGKFRDIGKALLESYNIESDVATPSFGIWYIIFSGRPSEIPSDSDEQFMSLTRAGRHLIRSMLEQSFGTATGACLEFKLAVIPVPEGTSAKVNMDHLKNYLRTLPATGRPHTAISPSDFSSIIEKQDMDIFLMSIISLPEGRVVGYEALSRGPLNSPVREAADLFGTASHLGMTKELEKSCIAKILEYGTQLPEPYWLTVNIGPGLIADPSFYQFINQRQYENIFPRLIFELTEQFPIQEPAKVHSAVQDLREIGLCLALDDTGCGFAHIETVRMLRPKIVKLCITVTRRIGRNPDIQRDIRAIVEKVSRLGSSVLGEGVEHEEQVQLMHENGVSLMQGYYYGQPRRIEEVISV
jgi:EAL domain-containing protein (putative c-di-GMP-specific phosphodiesterase class I)